jgi:hypothetical protein
MPSKSLYQLNLKSGKKCLSFYLFWHAIVPGFPLIGNLHQLREKRPHKTFAKWSDIYGPIYTIRTGASSIVVLNSTEVAKEVRLNLLLNLVDNVVS